MKNITKKQKNESWEYAFGLIKVDNLKPSIFLKDLTKKEIAGEISIEDILIKLLDRYKVNIEND